MINPNLHKKAVALDRDKHRLLKLKRIHDVTSMAGKLNAIFVAAAEFADACRDFPVVWVRAGQDPSGKLLVAPVAVMGVTQDQNLCIEGNEWRVRYVPAMLRIYPFAMARMSDTQVAVCFDESWPGISVAEGEPLFEPQGEPAALLKDVQKQLETLEVEIERTRLVGEKLLEKNLLTDMRFDATLPDGQKFTVDGFLTIDEKRLAELSDADVLEFHRNGLLGLIHAHQVSLGNMRRLTEWHAARVGAAPKPQP